jgi:hypothetical protein
VGTDRVTKVLLGLIAAGIWVMVLLQGVTTRRLGELNAEVTAIGVDTESIHEDIDPGGEGEQGDERTMSHRPDARQRHGLSPRMMRATARR